ncbi:MAG: tRNA (N(6)-L-threonylcarbamoyladenosine(37)-C(2))-methylthiotransferase MtaB [Clostridiales bacterium]|nr:tRNA (N(6)-L-threonylcarbamoyladenosine(37)-C(2))-methylthiotransferase MtaB [Clostridiales bacterium]
MRVAFFTLGCKVNHYETEVMARAFAQAGDRVVDFDGEADVFVVNTCTVTAVSDKKSRQALRAVRRRCPQATVVAVGCYAQVAAQALQDMPEVDLVLGNMGKPALPQAVRAYLARRERPAVGDIGALSGFEPMEAVTSERTRATLKIQDGCNNFCSYCIIPYARGRIRSKRPEQVLAEVAQLAQAGHLEIVLTGIEIASYGAGEDFDLLTLLEGLADIAQRHPDFRVRLGSLEPRIVDARFAQAVGRMPFVCPHFHLSLQSGCDDTLRRMNRKYDLARYQLSVELLRSHLPDTMLTTDVIVGFPGETEREFEQTLAAVTALRFLKVHVFPYSRRAGTPAAAMPDQLPQAEKARRAALLQAACDEVRAERMREQQGRLHRVLLEQWVEGRHHGYSQHYFPVAVAGAPADWIGRLVTARITGLEGDRLLGELVQDAP